MDFEEFKATCADMLIQAFNADGGKIGTALLGSTVEFTDPALVMLTPAFLTYPPEKQNKVLLDTIQQHKLTMTCISLRFWGSPMTVAKTIATALSNAVPGSKQEALALPNSKSCLMLVFAQSVSPHEEIHLYEMTSLPGDRHEISTTPHIPGLALINHINQFRGLYYRA